jgi:hypothetical protein
MNLWGFLKARRKVKNAKKREESFEKLLKPWKLRLKLSEQEIP